MSADGVDDDEAAFVCNFECRNESIGDVDCEVGVNGGLVETTEGLAVPVFGYTKCNGTDCGLSGILQFLLYFLCSVYLFINFSCTLHASAAMPKIRQYSRSVSHK